MKKRKEKIDKDKIYKLKLSYIKPYVKNISGKKLNKQKRYEISKYYREIRRLVGRPSFVFETKDKKKLKSVQEYSQQRPDKFPKIKVALVPTALPNPKISINKRGDVVVNSKYVKETAIRFPRFKGKVLKQFIDNPKKFIDDIVAKYPSKTHFALRIGKSKWKIPSVRNDVGNRIQEIVDNWGGDSQEKILRHFWGLTAYEFKNQKAQIDYQRKQVAYYQAKAHEKRPIPYRRVKHTKRYLDERERARGMGR